MLSYLRLVIVAAVAIGFLSLAGVALWYRGQALDAAAEAAQARADLNTAVAANKAQEETIGRLRASAERNDRIVAQMADDVAAINSAITETNEAVGSLEKSNEDVRAYLGTRVPADLDRLLNQ